MQRFVTVINYDDLAEMWNSLQIFYQNVWQNKEIVRVGQLRRVREYYLIADQIAAGQYFLLLLVSLILFLCGVVLGLRNVQLCHKIHCTCASWYGSG